MAVSTIDPAGLNIGQIGGSRNVIQNGSMVIAQRGTGSSAGNGWAVDRWKNPVNQSGKLTVQQNAGSVTPPEGFTNYYGVTSSTSYTPLAGDYFYVGHVVEGYNMARFGWGTSNAQSGTLSFWVRSSLTGTFGGSFQNGAQDWSFPFSYTINSANTWEYKTVSVSAISSGTWLTTNGKGLNLWFSVGVGSNNHGTAGAWVNSNIGSVSGAVDVVGTSGATWYITGVQLEVGEATPFEHEDVGITLQKAQRYFQKSYNIDVAPGTATPTGCQIMRASNTDSYLVQLISTTLVTLRATPTGVSYSPNTGTINKVRVGGSDVTLNSFHDAGQSSTGFPSVTSNPAAGDDCRWHFTLDAEL